MSEPWSLCQPHQSLNRSSSAVVGEIEPPSFVLVSRMVDAKHPGGARRLYVPEFKGWVSEVDGVGRVLLELREPDVQMVALSTRQSLLAFSGGAPDPRYVAPEQWQEGGAVDARTDLYSLAATVYRLLCVLTY